MTQFPLNCSHYVSKFGFVCLINNFCLAVIPEDKRAVEKSTSVVHIWFPHRAEVEMRNGFSAWLLSCSSTRKGSRSTCPTASKCTTTRAPPSVSTVAPSSGAWHGRGWSVTVSPWRRWHQLNMGGVVVFGGWQSENTNLIYRPSLKNHYEVPPRRVKEWSTGLNFKEDHSSRMKTAVHALREIWSSRMMSCYPERQKASQWHCSSPQITPSMNLQALFPLSGPRHFTVFIIPNQWEDPFLWLQFISEIMACSFSSLNLQRLMDVEVQCLARRKYKSSLHREPKTSRVPSQELFRWLILLLASSSTCPCPTLYSLHCPDTLCSFFQLVAWTSTTSARQK